MLKFRIIARLDIRNECCITPIRADGVRRVGDPNTIARKFDGQGIDELIYLDTVASLYDRRFNLEMVKAATEAVFTPIAVGGGIKYIADARELLRSGADKVALNSAALERPRLINELADAFGSQAVVVHIDCKRFEADNRDGVNWLSYKHGGRQRTHLHAIDWAIEAAERGAGEILVTSIDQQGTSKGLDELLIARMASAVPVPVIAGGGIGKPEDVVVAHSNCANGVAIASAFHRSGMTLSSIRQAFSSAGLRLRIAA